MSSNIRKNTSYINTLIFAIVAGVVSVGLLVVIMYANVDDYKYALITIEAGLIGVIVYALVRIYIDESTAARMASNAHKNALLAKNCPDYYTMVNSAKSGQQCINTFKGVAPTGDPFVMVYTPSGRFKEDSGMGGKKKVIFSGNPPDSSIDIKAFEDQSVQEACLFVAGRPVDGDTNTKTSNNYSIPWTDMRSKCDGLSYS